MIVEPKRFENFRHLVYDKETETFIYKGRSETDAIAFIERLVEFCDEINRLTKPVLFEDPQTKKVNGELDCPNPIIIQDLIEERGLRKGWNERLIIQYNSSTMSHEVFDMITCCVVFSHISEARCAEFIEHLKGEKNEHYPESR